VKVPLVTVGAEGVGDGEGVAKGEGDEAGVANGETAGLAAMLPAPGVGGTAATAPNRGGAIR
jgi:hypothetical protein